MEMSTNMNSDVRRVLENLTTTKFMEDIDYRNTRFSFRTLFHSTPLEYRFCPCGYNHEYLNYISPTGEVDKDMFGEILDYISDGNCPHVGGAPETHVQVSTVYAMHFVAALGTKEAICKYNDVGVEYSDMFGLFRVHPLGMALMEKRPDVLGELLKNYPLQAERKSGMSKLSYAHRLSDNPLRIQINDIYLLELCIMQNHELLLTQFLKHWAHARCLTKAFVFTLEHGSSLMEKIMLDHIKHLVQNGNVFYIYPCAEAAVMFNRVDVLQQILHWPPRKNSSGWSQRKNCKLMEEMLDLFKLSTQLHRHDCSNAINGLFKRNQNPPEYEGIANHILIYLKGSYDRGNNDCYDSIRQDMVPVMKELAKCQDEQNILCYTIRNILAPLGHCDFPNAKTLTVKALLECGGDINTLLGSYANSGLLLRMGPEMKGQLLYKDFRHNIEMLLSANLNFEARASILDWCIRIDEGINRHVVYCYQPGDYVLDMITHAHSGHTEQALHYMVPLLMECGCRFKTAELLKATERRLHCEEIKYIKKYINEPRPLVKQCIDVLRRHFKGQNSHAYVERTCVPLRLKNYILLKDILLIGSITV